MITLFTLLVELAVITAIGVLAAYVGAYLLLRFVLG
jgi:hypothetical protein